MDDKQTPVNMDVVDRLRTEVAARKAAQRAAGVDGYDLADDHCPGCGHLIDSLPDGHMWSLNLSTGERSCTTVEPVSVEDYIGSAAKPSWF